MDVFSIKFVSMFSASQSGPAVSGVRSASQSAWPLEGYRAAAHGNFVSTHMTESGIFQWASIDRAVFCARMSAFSASPDKWTGG
jgi:hypothetical protein